MNAYTDMITEKLSNAFDEINALRAHIDTLVRHNRLFAKEYQKLKDKHEAFRKLAANLPPTFSLPPEA